MSCHFIDYQIYQIVLLHFFFYKLASISPSKRQGLEIKLQFRGVIIPLELYCCPKAIIKLQ